MNVENMEKYLEERTAHLEKLIDECTSLKEEWEERIKEAKQARDNYLLLMRQLVSENISEDE